MPGYLPPADGRLTYRTSRSGAVSASVERQGSQSLFGFLRGGGQTGSLMRAYDWSLSPLGSPSDWPAALSTLVEVTLGADQPMCIIWGPERILLYNDRYADILMQKHPAAIGQPISEVWHEVWPDFGPLVERAFAGEAINVENIRLLVNRKGFPEEAHFAFSYTPVRGPEDAVAGVFCPCHETTETTIARASLEAEKDRLGELFQQAPGFMCVLHGPEHRFEIINDSYLQLVGHRRDIVGKSIRDALPEVAGQGFFELLDEVFSTGKPFVGHNMPVFLQREPGSRSEQRFIDLVYQPITNRDGKVTGIFVEGYDVSELVAAERQQKLLMQELNHRVHNLFAVVSGMVALTARSSETPQDMAKSLRGRLDALARANDLIHPGLIGADAGEEAGTSLEILLRAIVLPYSEQSRDQGRECIHIDGRAVPICGDAVTNLALIFHEITTNSAKYGALSAPRGRVHIGWDVRDGDLHLRWEERDGPPILTPPQRQGFGSKLVSRSVTSQLQGRIEHDWRREGLVITVTVPVERLSR
jgi:two-component sensor histidine kinase